MKLIQTQTLATASPTIIFSSIPQTFTDLVLLVSSRTTNAGYGLHTDLLLRPNGATTNLSDRALYGDGATPGSNTTSTIRNATTSSGATSNTFGNATFYIPNYTTANSKNVSADSITENNATTAYQYLIGGLWSNSAAITSLTLATTTGDLAIGTVVSLYGVGGAGDGGPKATGGMITKSGNYWVHTFTASGTFTPTTSISDVEYLVVAGGAGGGGYFGGGGGAGGYRSSVTGESSGGGASAESKLSLTSGTAYTVTVGAGGAFRTNGSNSVFGSITSTGGGMGAIGGGAASPSDGAVVGGSGGGGATDTDTFNGAAGTTGQGFAGGTSPGFVPNYPSGGGGGAGAVGVSPVNTSAAGGAGGAGVSSSINGTATVRGGGGGGASDGGPNAAGGTGGGGAGSYGYNPPIGGANGTTNTGGGGGGGNAVSLGTTGWSGGSGIVIVRYAA
jgi:hypothetical protein